jgi:hypothetical protein
VLCDRERGAAGLVYSAEQGGLVCHRGFTVGAHFKPGDHCAPPMNLDAVKRKLHEVLIDESRLGYRAPAPYNAGLKDGLIAAIALMEDKPDAQVRDEAAQRFRWGRELRGGN